MLAVIRIRGTTGINPRARKTGELLKLHKINHMVLLEDNDSTRGMLQAFKDYATWGEIDQKTLELTLMHRARLQGRKPLTENDLEKVKAKSYSDLAKSIVSGKVKYSDIEGIVPVIRLHPPVKGLEYVRKSYNQGGSLGDRGKEINNLILRMLKPGEDLNGKNTN